MLPIWTSLKFCRLVKSYPKKRTEYLKILPRHRTVRFRKLASKGHNHQQETYSRPILHRGFNFYFHVQNQSLKYQIPPISFSIG